MLFVFSGKLLAADADLNAAHLRIGGETVNSSMSNGAVIGDRWVVISNKLIRLHAEVTPIDAPPDTNPEYYSKPALRLIFHPGQGPTKDRSMMHGGVTGLHGLLYMAKGLNTPDLMRTSPVDVLSAEDKTIIVVMVRNNGPIYTSTNSGTTWTVVNTPGTYEFPLTFDSDGNSFLAEATLYPSPENQTPTNPPTSNWYAIGSASDGSKLVMTGDVSPVLNIKYSANAATLSWSTNFAGFKVQQNSDLTLTNWVYVTNSVNVVGDENRVIISPANGNAFYRLKSQSF